MAKRNMPPKEVEEIVDSEPEKVGEPVVLVVANCTRLNVRQQPNILSKVLCVIPAGTVVIVDEVSGDWLHISSFGDAEEESENSQPGFILGQYTQEV